MSVNLFFSTLIKPMHVHMLTECQSYSETKKCVDVHLHILLQYKGIICYCRCQAVSLRNRTQLHTMSTNPYSRSSFCTFIKIAWLYRIVCCFCGKCSSLWKYCRSLDLVCAKLLKICPMITVRIFVAAK